MSNIVNCPRCKKEVVWNSQSEFRPFCSERCKLQDLGAWFTEEHSIEGEIDPVTFKLNQLKKADTDFN